ncbi:MAG: hypothetical protein KDA24_13740 [Deltaproteobacteria bacterium]|nr:hypothetical protein [Deltaproteobacteria bacterium]
MIPTRPFALLGALASALLLAPVLAWAQDDDLDLDEEGGEAIFEEWGDEELFQRVLIVPFAGETAESSGIGDLLEGYVATALDNSGQFETYLLDEVEDVEDVSARLYYEGCPPEQELGCQFVIGESSRVDRVVSGRVTVQSDDRYRVVVTILGVENAELEFTYALDLAAGEEVLLPRTVELALDRLRREELLEPLRDAEARADRRREVVSQARDAEEQELVGRMRLEVDEGAIERAEEEREARARSRVTTQDLEEQKGIEGITPDWEQMGLTERQYLSYRNSGLSTEDWARKFAGHRLMFLVSAHVGFAAGATGLRYYGGYLLSDNLSSTVDSYSWQRSTGGTSPNIGFSLGFGLLRNLNIEASIYYSRSKVYAKLASGSAVPCATDEGCAWKPDPDNRPTGDWTEQAVDTFGGDIMVRYSILVMPIVRPTVGLGAVWQVYPNLYNDPNIPDNEEQPAPSIPSRFQTYGRLVDVGPQVEIGVALDFNRNLGLFVRAPVALLVNPNRVQESPAPPTIIIDAPEPENAPPGLFRLVVGVQGRIGGKPIKIRESDNVDEIDEY